MKVGGAAMITKQLAIITTCSNTFTCDAMQHFSGVKKSIESQNQNKTQYFDIYSFNHLNLLCFLFHLIGLLLISLILLLSY